MSSATVTSHPDGSGSFPHGRRSFHLCPSSPFVRELSLATRFRTSLFETGERPGGYMGTGPDPKAARTPAEFVATMRQLRSWADLSYRQLERKANDTGDALPRATISGVLARQDLPREEVLIAFVRACGGDAAVNTWLDARRQLAMSLVPAAPDGAGEGAEALPPRGPAPSPRRRRAPAAPLALAPREARARPREVQRRLRRRRRRATVGPAGAICRSRSPVPSPARECSCSCCGPVGTHPTPRSPATAPARPPALSTPGRHPRHPLLRPHHP